MIAEDERSFDSYLLFWEGDTDELDAFLGSRNWNYADNVGVDFVQECDTDDPRLVVWSEDAQVWLPCPLYHYVLKGEYPGRAPWVGVMKQDRIET